VEEEVVHLVLLHVLTLVDLEDQEVVHQEITQDLYLEEQETLLR
jgi:hypothetical protein